MEQVWSWLATTTTGTILLAGGLTTNDKSIVLQADTTTTNDDVIFSISLKGFTSTPTPLWLSNPIPPSSSHHHHLLTQLLQEIIIQPSRTLNFNDHIFTDANSNSLPSFFTLALIVHLFRLICNAPADAGFLFFRSVGPTLLAKTIENSRPAMRSILAAIGTDWEELFMRSVGYAIAKLCILQDLQVGPTTKTPPLPAGCCPSYVADAHGLWVLKGYAPIQAMQRLTGTTGHSFDVKDSVLRYALAHQQLEAVVQLEYSVSMRGPRYIRVTVRVDNIRLRTVKLGFIKHEDQDAVSETHFPSKIRVWVGPESGSAYATGLSLSLSSEKGEREAETEKVVKGKFGGGEKSTMVKARMRSSVRSRCRDWRWEQDAEGNAGIFQGVLSEKATKMSGRLVVRGEEVGDEGVSWRVGREMEGRSLKWRVGGKVWVTYGRSGDGYFETRCVEWRDEVDLDLVACGCDCNRGFI